MNAARDLLHAYIQYMVMPHKIHSVAPTLNKNQAFHLFPNNGGGEVAPHQDVCVSDQKIDGLLHLCSSHFDNSHCICMSPTCSSQCCLLVQQRPYHVLSCLLIMHVKDPQLSVVRVGYCVPLAGFYLSLYDLHALNMDFNMIQTNKQTNKIHLNYATHL